MIARSRARAGVGHAVRAVQSAQAEVLQSSAGTTATTRLPIVVRDRLPLEGSVGEKSWGVVGRNIWQPSLEQVDDRPVEGRNFALTPRETKL